MGNPNQPRVPAGSPDGGQFASGGGGSGGAGARIRRKSIAGQVKGLADVDFLKGATAFVRSGRGRTTIDIAHPATGVKQTLRSRDERGKQIISSSRLNKTHLDGMKSMGLRNLGWKLKD